MTAQEQMKKMLDELMGTQRDGEYKICAVKVKLARYVSIEFEDTFYSAVRSTFVRLASSYWVIFCILTK